MCVSGYAYSDVRDQFKRFAVISMVDPHAPYLLDLALCDIWLFAKVKMTGKGKCFGSIQDMQAAMTALRKEDSESGKNGGLSVLQVSGRAMNGRVSFAGINIF